MIALDILHQLRLIEYEFGQFGPANQSYYGYFNTSMLNKTASVVNESIASTSPIAPGLLLATLQAYNATGTSNNGSANNDSGASTNNNGDGSPKQTGLAM